MKPVTVLSALATLATAAPFYPIPTGSLPPPPSTGTGLAVPTGGFLHPSFNATFPSASGYLPLPPHVTGRPPRPHGTAAPSKHASPFELSEASAEFGLSTSKSTFGESGAPPSAAPSVLSSWGSGPRGPDELEPGGHGESPGSSFGTGGAGTGVPRLNFSFPTGGFGGGASPTGFPNATGLGSLPGSASVHVSEVPLPTGSDARGLVGLPRYTPKPSKGQASVSF